MTSNLTKEKTSKNVLNDMLKEASFDNTVKFIILCATFIAALHIISNSVIEYNKVSHNCVPLHQTL